jgi:uncharacterized protein YkwD
MLLFLMFSCMSPKIIPKIKIPQVRYRPDLESKESIVQILHNGVWDEGLGSAADQLLLQLRSPQALLNHESIRIALARAGFPGQARFAKLLNKGDFPKELVRQLVQDVGDEPVDVALRSRSYGNGTTLWLLGWAPHLIDIDPMPREVALDESFSIRIEAKKDQEAMLFIAPPDGEVDKSPLLSAASRSVPNMHIPGEYRYEVIVQSPRGPQVAALFSVFADLKPESVPELAQEKHVVPNSIEAERFLYGEVNRIRQERGLRPLHPFEPFAELAREHSAWMASTGIVSHSIPGVTQGVQVHARRLFHPYAEHHESIAAAQDAKEALDVVISSPAHLQTFLCGDCTHISIGATIEPILDRVPRLFVTWEMLRFPQGESLRKDRFTRDD